MIVSPTKNDGESKETTQKSSQSSTPTTISPRIQSTLDPCVVLMKELMAQYADRWTTTKEDGTTSSGIYSLAQGVVYWNPPLETTRALQEAVASPSVQMLHCYGPDEGVDELRTRLGHKVAQSNGLSDHSIMVTAGANQAYMNCVLALLSGAGNTDDDSYYAVVFAP